MYIILAILIFSLLIFVHELGHFLAAKLCGVKVNEFSMCMGPAIVQKTVGETTYSLRCIPIGGYCAMEGEDGDSDDPRSFTNQAVWKRFIILVAGAFNNFLAGILILLVLFGTVSGFNTTTISGFFEGCPLEGEYGLQTGDRIVSIDGERIYIFSDLTMLLDRGSDSYYDVTLIRDGEKVRLKNFPFQPQYYEIDGQTVYKYGIYFASVENSPWQTLRYAVGTAMDFWRMVRLSLVDLFTGGASVKDVSGVVGIVSVINETGQAADTVAEGVENVFYFGAFLAVNLAFMNLLPIPALDGGRVFFLLVTAVIEAIRKKKVDPKYEGYIHAAGMVLLLAFVAVITMKDIINLF